MMTNHAKSRTATQDGYFAKSFDRVFTVREVSLDLTLLHFIPFTLFSKLQVLPFFNYILETTTLAKKN